MIKSQNNICVIGLGYVGMTLAYEFFKHFNIIGFDINKQKIGELKKEIDRNGQIKRTEWKAYNLLFFNKTKKNF